MSGNLDFIHDSEIFIDLYSILEIEMDANNNEIKNAYIQLAKKNHPDHGGSSEIFQQITKAYEILYNKEKRKEYDLYYLKKSMDEFKGDEIIRLKEDYKNFVALNKKPITKDELDKIYDESFNRDREKYNEIKLNEDNFDTRINDIKLERENINIETLDDSLINFMKENENIIKLNEIFEYLKYKNSNCFEKDIIIKDIGTLDLLPEYSSLYSSFINENEFYNSNLYSDISNINNNLSKEAMDNLNIEDFVKWKDNKKNYENVLNNSDLEYYLKKREEEGDNLFKEIDKNLYNNTKKKEVQNFLKNNFIMDELNQDNLNQDNLNQDNLNQDNIEQNINDILSHMQKTKDDNFSFESTFSNNNLEESNKKVSNVRKREFK